MNKIPTAIVPPLVYKTLTRDYGFKYSQIPNLSGKTALITGGTNGIGLFVSRALYASGASKIILLSSTESVAQKAISYIKTGDVTKAPDSYCQGFGGADKYTEGDLRQDGNGEIVWKKCSLENLNEVKSVANEISQEDRLDLLLCIAGLGVNEFERGQGDYDKHLLINSLGHVVLTNNLLPLLRKTAKMPGTDVRMIHMSSELHRATFGGPSETVGGSKFTKSEFKEEASPQNLYARTKLAVLLFVKGLVQKTSVGESPIRVYATHPGAVSTGQQEQFVPAYGETAGKIVGAAVSWAMRTPLEGAMSVLWSATSEAARDKKYPQGTYFTDPEELGKESSEANSQELIDNFWTNSQEVIQELAPDALISWEQGALPQDV